MLQSQKKLIIVLAVCFVLMLTVYLAVVKPLTEKEDVVTTEPLVTVEGEIIGTNNRYQLFEQVERADMQSIEVHNEHGSYKFYRNSKDAFVIEGHEETLFNAQLFSQLVVDTGYTLAKAKVADNASDVMYKYGLDEESDPAYYTLTTLNGKKHTVYVGNRITTQGGFYVRYAGRDSVYILDTSLGATVLRPIEDYVTPLLSYPMTLTTYYLIKDFSILRGEELFASFRYLEDNEKSETVTFSTFEMKYPGGGYYCPSQHLDSALQQFTDYEGSEVVRLSPSEEELETYFPDGFSYTLHKIDLVPKDTEDWSKGYNEIENFLFYSSLHEDRDGNNYYYCYSMGFDIIAKVPYYKAEFLTWDINLWVNETIYQLQIDTVRQLKFESPELGTVTFDLAGEGQELVVTEKETGHKPIVKNFRQLYKTILTVNKEGEHGLSDDELKQLTETQGAYQLTMTAYMRSGKVLEYRFFNYSDRRSYYSINGVKGEFYVLRTSVNKLISDVIRVQKDETVNSEDKY